MLVRGGAGASQFGGNGIGVGVGISMESMDIFGFIGYQWILGTRGVSGGNGMGKSCRCISRPPHE